MKAPLTNFVFGAGGHAAEIIGSAASTALRLGVGMKTIGVIVDAPFMEQAVQLYGHLPIFTPDKVPESATWIMCAIGSSRLRADIVKRYPGMPWGSLLDSDIRREPALSPQSGRDHDGVYQAAWSYLGPFASVGDHVHINRAAQVAHGCVLSPFVTVGPMANLLGGVHVGEGTEIGGSAVVLPGVKIGKWCRVGAGAIVTKDVPDGATVRCEPAR